MDRGNSLPCVLEQKVRGSGRARGWWAGGRSIYSGGAACGEAREVNALRGLPEVADGGQQGSWGRWMQHGMNPVAPTG